MKNTFTIFILTSILLLPLRMLAQWVNDASLNTLVSGTENTSTYALISTCTDGSAYISSWKNTGNPNHFELWLQRIDRHGVRLWGNDGILVSNHKCRTWLSAYSLKTDESGNAILAIEDIRKSETANSVYIYKIDPQGQFLWGADGVAMGSSNDMSYSPTLEITNAGNILVACNVIFGDTNTHSLAIRVMKYSPAGQPLWSAPVTYTGPDSTCRVPMLAPVDADDFIMTWLNMVIVDTAQVGSLEYQYIHAQRFGAAGQPLWAQTAVICDLGKDAYKMPEFLEVATARDRSEGLYLAWYDDRASTSTHDIYVQHMDKNGNMLWAQNGIPVVTPSAKYSRFEPVMAVYPGTDDAAVFWTELNLASGYTIGMVGQKFTYEGKQLWGKGKVISNFSSDTLTYLFGAIPSSGHDLVLGYSKEFVRISGPDTTLILDLAITSVDSSGAKTWNPGDITIASTDDYKYSGQLVMADSMYVVSWNEDRSVPGSRNPYGQIFAQNILFNGKRGPLGTGDKTVPAQGKIWPNPTAGESTLSFDNPCSGTAVISVTTMTGETVRESVTLLPAGKCSLTLDGRELPAGIYLIEVNTGCGKIRTKWMKL